MDKLVLGIKSAGEKGQIVLASKTGVLAKCALVLDHTLSEKIVGQIEKLLDKAGFSFANLRCVVIYRGPGSFTSLRISHSVANTISSTLDIPIAGITASQLGQRKYEDMVYALGIKGKKGGVILPFYGGKPNITKSKKKS